MHSQCFLVVHYFLKHTTRPWHPAGIQLAPVLFKDSTWHQTNTCCWKKTQISALPRSKRNLLIRKFHKKFCTFVDILLEISHVLLCTQNILVLLLKRKMEEKSEIKKELWEVQHIKLSRIMPFIPSTAWWTVWGADTVKDYCNPDALRNTASVFCLRLWGFIIHT